MFLPNIKQIFKARSIFKEGQITEGEIVFIGRKKFSIASNFKAGSNLEVFFSFEIKTGKRIESMISTDSDWLVCKLEGGSPVTVAYLEAKPKISIILDFYYR